MGLSYCLVAVDSRPVAAQEVWRVAERESVEDLNGDLGMGAGVVRFVAFSPRTGILVPIDGNKRPGILGLDGTLKATVGSVGRGPGEFLFINALGIHPDGTAWAFDPRQARLTRFTADGEFLDSSRCIGSLCVLLPSGTKIAFAQRPLGSLNPTARLTGFSFTVTRFGADGESELRSVEVPYGQLQIQQANGGVFVTSNPWGGQPEVSIGPETQGVAVLVPTRRVVEGQIVTEIWWVDEIGTLEVIEFLRPARRIESSDVRQWARDFVATPRRTKLTVGAVENALDPPDFFPGATRIVAAGGGKFWLMLESAASGQRWAKVNQGGKIEGEARFPGGIQVLLAHGNRLLAIRPDDYDVPILTWFEVH